VGVYLSIAGARIWRYEEKVAVDAEEEEPLPIGEGMRGTPKVEGRVGAEERRRE
jgi:hypothetical protein